MNKPLGQIRRASACPHDCPSTCALEVEVLDANTIGRVYGAADNSYTKGVISQRSRAMPSVHITATACCIRCCATDRRGRDSTSASAGTRPWIAPPK